MEATLVGNQVPEGFADVVAGLAELGDDELAGRYREVELAQRRLAAEQAAITHEVETRGLYRADGHRSVLGWLRAQGNYSGGHLTQIRRLARLFASEPQIGEDLTAGQIGADHAAELARAFANPRCGHLLSSSLDILLEHAQRLKFDDFRRCVQRWEILADRDGAHRDHRDAVESRRAAIVAGPHGVDVAASGGTVLQAAQMAAILEAFADAEFHRDVADLRERLGPDAPSSELARTDAQRRFDALVTILNTANNADADNTPPATTVNIVCDQYPFESAMARHHLADEPVDLPAPDPADVRCHTSTGIPLQPDDVVLAALGGWIRRVVVDSADVVINMGRRSRIFTGAAAEAARLLVTVCDMPGCTVPEHWAQIDHIAEWADGGHTDQDNAAILCGRENRHKHRQRLTTRRDRDGKLHVQRPDGTWIVAIGCDPPNDADFLTEDQIRQRILDRLNGQSRSP